MTADEAREIRLGTMVRCVDDRARPWHDSVDESTMHLGIVIKSNGQHFDILLANGNFVHIHHAWCEVHKS